MEIPFQLNLNTFKIEMVDTKSKKIFRVHLSISIVLLLLTLGSLSLFASFYLGMITGKSMQRPPEKSIIEDEFNLEKSITEDDLKFFGLGERQKDQDVLDLEEIKELKNKTEELSKITELKKTKPPNKPKIFKPKVDIPRSPDKEQKILNEKVSTSSSKNEQNKSRPEIQSSPKIESNEVFTIQVFATRNHKNAKNLIGKLKKDGFGEAFIFKHTAGNKTLFRVRVGKVSQKNAKIMAKKLKKLKYIDSVQISRF